MMLLQTEHRVKLKLYTISNEDMYIYCQRKIASTTFEYNITTSTFALQRGAMSIYIAIYLCAMSVHS